MGKDRKLHIHIDELRPIVKQLNNEEITYGRAVELISEIADSYQDEWISTKNEKDWPKDGEKIQVLTNHCYEFPDNWYTGIKRDDKFHFAERGILGDKFSIDWEDITHWKPQPQPPTIELDLDTPIINNNKCTCEDKHTKHFLSNWCNDCKAHIV